MLGHYNGNWYTLRWLGGRLALGLGVLLGGAALGWWLLGGTSAFGSEQIGGVASCRALPKFGDRLGYKGRLGISTSERGRAGLVIFDARLPLSAPLEQRAIHQEPSWAAAGTLGPFVLDRAGNIYSAAVPRTALSDNPPAAQNTIYRVDSLSGELQPFVVLPGAPAASPENPFGILGLTYDCDSDALYVSTVAGSSRRQERGRVLRVDLGTREVSDEVVGVDAIGLGVFRGAAGKRLYLGMARDAALASVALDAGGHATGEIRDELRLADTGSLGEPRARRISFDKQQMTVYIVPFNFNLRAVSEQQQLVARYSYDAAQDSWARDARGS